MGGFLFFALLESRIASGDCDQLFSTELAVAGGKMDCAASIDFVKGSVAAAPARFRCMRWLEKELWLANIGHAFETRAHTPCTFSRMHTKLGILTRNLEVHRCCIVISS